MIVEAFDLRPYTAMRFSGANWLGDVPEHWPVLPLCAVATVKTVRGKEDRSLLSVYLDRGVIRFSEVDEKRTNPTSTDLTQYQAVDPGDFVLNNQQAWRGSVGVSSLKGIVSPAYLVLSLRPQLHPRFANYLFRSQVMVDQYLVCSRGVGTIQRNLYWPSLKRITFPAPPIPEQVGIVSFLDHADQRIQRYIRAKEGLVGLLEEQTQAIIHQAVTGQIDVRTGRPYPAYKDSGAEWLGEVPEHWQLVPNRTMLSRRKVLVGDDHTQFILLSLTKSGVIVRDVSTGRGKFSADMGTSQEVRSGDLVFCLFDVPETPRTVGLSNHDGMITGAYTVFECDGPLLRRFLEAFYIAMDDRKLLQPLYSGLRNTIPPSRLLAAKTPIPPKDEQAAILEYLDDSGHAAKSATIHAKREVELLEEYRTRLIADVVTGKLDVREAAASLPGLDPLAHDTRQTSAAGAGMDPEESTATVQSAHP